MKKTTMGIFHFSGGILLVVILSITSALGVSIFPWTNGIVTITLAASYVAITNVNLTLVISMSAGSVPTTLRGMAVNIAVMFGRLGVFLGNVLVPVLAEIKCELQFLTMALFHFVCVILIITLIRIQKNNPTVVS